MMIIIISCNKFGSSSKCKERSFFTNFKTAGLKALVAHFETHGISCFAVRGFVRLKSPPKCIIIETLKMVTNITLIVK